MLIFTKKQSRFVRSRRLFLQGLGLAAATGGILPGRVPMVEEDRDAYPRLEDLIEEHRRKGIIPPEQTYRMMEWSLHFPPQGKFEFNLEEAMRLAREAGTESMLFYAQDCWGYALFPSDVGVRHPNLTFDFFGKQVSLARKERMSTVAYYLNPA